MPNCAIICEYNPLHNGHVRLLNAARGLAGDGAVVCLMSGNFVQRGEPARLHRLDRAAAALACGADIVLELPLTTAIASAEAYAAGAVRIAAALGGIEYLCYGSESGDAERHLSVARTIKSERFSAILRQKLDEKLPFAAARQAALEKLSGDGAMLANPNDILAIEYCKALLETDIQPWTLRREGAYHGGSDPAQPSASWLRANPDDWAVRMPAAALELQQNAPKYGFAYGERAVLARLRTLSDAEWEALPYGGEGLWRRVMFAARQGTSLDEIMSTAATKRYPHARLRRLLLCAYLGVTVADLARPAPYVRLLGFSPRGQALLKQWRKAPLSIVHTGETGPDVAYQALESRADALFALLGEEILPTRVERVVRG